MAPPGLTERDIKEILEVASEKNKQFGITGCLIYHNDFFLQFLEGEESDVMNLIENIKLDSRNEFLTILATDTTPFRIFKEWSMAYYHPPHRKEMTEEEEKVRQDLLMLADTSKKPNFTLKVFWYNVKQILLSEGYFKDID